MALRVSAAYLRMVREMVDPEGSDEAVSTIGGNHVAVAFSKTHHVNEFLYTLGFMTSNEIDHESDELLLSVDDGRELVQSGVVSGSSIVFMNVELT